MAADSAIRGLSARSLIISAALMFGAVWWWAGRGGSVAPGNPSAGSFETGYQDPEIDGRERRAAGATGVGEAAHESQPADSENVSDVSFRDYVGAKYRFLFKDAGLSPEDTAALTAILLERERIAVAINTARQSSDPSEREAIARHQSELEAVDRKAGALLRARDLSAFEVLKDSDIEQFQLDDYAGGISEVAPVSEADKKAILYTKLNYRQRFRQVLADSRFMRDDLDPGERRLAFAEVRRALEISRDSYLQEVRQYLYNEEQFTLLRNYETTEFRDELEKLRRMAYGE